MTNAIIHIQIESQHDLTPLQKFVRGCLPNANREDATERFPIEIFRAASPGLASAFIPEILGGPGLNTLDLAYIAREIAYSSSGIFSSTVNVLALSPIILCIDDLKAKLCADFLGQFSLWSYCMTEPGAGSNIAHAHTRARKVTGGCNQRRKMFHYKCRILETPSRFAQLESEDQSSESNRIPVPVTAGITRSAPPQTRTTTQTLAPVL